MSVAKVSDIVSELTKNASVSLDNAIARRIAGGSKTLRDLRVWWIKEARVTNGSATQYQVNLMIGFVIDDYAEHGRADGHPLQKMTYDCAKYLAAEGRADVHRRLLEKGREVHGETSSGQVESSSPVPAPQLRGPAQSLGSSAFRLPDLTGNSDSRGE